MFTRFDARAPSKGSDSTGRINGNDEAPMEGCSARVRLSRGENQASESDGQDETGYETGNESPESIVIVSKYGRTLNVDDSHESSLAEKENSAQIENSSSPQISAVPDMPLSERKETSQEVIDFIKNSCYKKVFIGSLDMEKPVHMSLRRKGDMNAEEKALFDHVNNILQYPPCVEKAEAIMRKQTQREYGHSIAKYVEFMAGIGITPDTFEVDGKFMCKCMKEWDTKRIEKEEMEASNSQATMSKFKSSMGALQQFIAVFKLKSCHDEDEYDRKYKELTHIPNLHSFDEYIKERQSPSDQTPKEKCHVPIQGRITIENMKAMMRTRLSETASGDKKAIYDGINARLEYMLGHYYFLRSSNKCLLEISDAVWDTKIYEKQTLNILGFHILAGKTPKIPLNAGKCGALRHRDVDLCFVSAFAMSLWFRFDFENGPLHGENFPDFLDKSSWYPIKVLFSTGKSMGREPISYRYSHALKAKTIATIDCETQKKPGKKAKNPNITDTSANEESSDEHAAVWLREATQSYHLTDYPLEYLKFSAGFNKDEPYYISRDIEVPEELQRLIFPWLEDVISKVEHRDETENANCLEQDGVVLNFLKMLKVFRSIIIQDLAVMMDNSPNNMFTQHIITKNHLFIEFRASMNHLMKDTNEGNEMKVAKNSAATAPSFTEKMEAVRGILERQCTSTAKVREELESIREEMKEEFNDLVASWKDDLLTKLKENLVYNAQDYIRKNTSDDVTSAIESTLIQSAINEVTSEITKYFTPINERLLVIEDKISKLGQLHMADGDSAENIATKESGTKRQKVCTLQPTSKEKPCEIPEKHRFISRYTSSVINAYHEWYTCCDDYMSFKMRDENYGVAWRKDNPTIGLYKRRRHLHKFIEDQTRFNQKFMSFSKEEFARLLDVYRSKKVMRLSALCERLGKVADRSKIAEDLEEMLKEQSLEHTQSTS